MHIHLNVKEGIFRLLLQLLRWIVLTSVKDVNILLEFYKIFIFLMYEGYVKLYLDFFPLYFDIIGRDAMLIHTVDINHVIGSVNSL